MRGDANNHFPSAEILVGSLFPDLLEMKQVTVIGSLNIDYVTRVESLPAPGETVTAERLDLFRGGKGANQALAAVLQGCKVVLFGAVGSDEEGAAYRSELKVAGVNITHVRTVAGQTGSAFITVDRNGENTIIIAAGANGALRGSDITGHREVIEAGSVLLAQFEIPTAPLVEAARIANDAGIPVIVNPSPANPIFPWEKFQTDYAIVNEKEAFEILGFPATLHELALIRDMMHQLRIANLIVTRGSDETLVFRREGEPLTIPTLPVLPVDTVGAGDAFAGCFAARLARGETLVEALSAANCAGALTTLGAGAQEPMPDRERVDQHLAYLSTPTHQVS